MPGLALPDPLSCRWAALLPLPPFTVAGLLATHPPLVRALARGLGRWPTRCVLPALFPAPHPRPVSRLWHHHLLLLLPRLLSLSLTPSCQRSFWLDPTVLSLPTAQTAQTVGYAAAFAPQSASVACPSTRRRLPFLNCSVLGRTFVLTPIGRPILSNLHMYLWSWLPSCPGPGLWSKRLPLGLPARRHLSLGCPVLRSARRLGPLLWAALGCCIFASRAALLLGLAPSCIFYAQATLLGNASRSAALLLDTMHLAALLGRLAQCYVRHGSAAWHTATSGTARLLGPEPSLPLLAPSPLS